MKIERMLDSKIINDLTKLLTTEGQVKVLLTCIGGPDELKKIIKQTGFKAVIDDREGVVIFSKKS